MAERNLSRLHISMTRPGRCSSSSAGNIMRSIPRISIIRAPMPGRVIRIAVEEGQKVSPGAPLIVMEAMKMEHTLKAGLHGTVKRIPVNLGAQVKEGDPLCVLESASP